MERVISKMLSYAIFLLLLIPVFYLGNVFGLAMQSYNTKLLKSIRNLVWIIPFMQVEFFFYLLKKPSHRSRLKLICGYVFLLKYKNLVLAQCLSDAIVSYKEKHPTTPYAVIRKCARLAKTDVSKLVGQLAYA